MRLWCIFNNVIKMLGKPKDEPPATSLSQCNLIMWGLPSEKFYLKFFMNGVDAVRK